MSKQKIVDILGIIILLGCIPWYWGITQDLWLGLCIEIGLFIICCFRIFVFRSIPEQNRRCYDIKLFNWRILGRDTLIQPYTQTAIIGLFLIANVVVIFQRMTK